MGNLKQSELQKAAQLQKASFKKKLDALKKQKDGVVDTAINNLHETVFACTDCLKCANCCKTTGPLFLPKDIERIAKHLKLKPGVFVEKYLKIDEDNDYVLKAVPCAFLGSDNYCSIYEVRPKACASYPHTDMRNQKTLLTLLLKNTEICPAAFEIVTKL
jgi:Fe-S-cluster containining protein